MRSPTNAAQRAAQRLGSVYPNIPLLGAEVIDTQGVALIEAWLSQLQTKLSQRALVQP
jgi:hypothetical protein